MSNSFFNRIVDFLRGSRNDSKQISSPNDPESALNIKISQNGELREQLFHIQNKIGRNPGDIGLIHNYVNFIVDEVKSEDIVDILDTLDQLERFLMEQSRYVAPEDVDSLLQLASELDDKRQEHLSEYEETVEHSEADESIIETLETWKTNGFDTTIPTNPRKTKQKLELCRNVKSLVQSRGETMLEGLENYINQLKSVHEIDDMLEKATSLIQVAKNESHSSEAAYELQSAEQIIRQLVIKRFEVDGRTEEIEQAVRELEEASNEISRQQREMKDEHTWNKFLDEHDGLIEEFKSWSPKRVEGEFKNGKKRSELDEEDNSNMVKTHKEPSGNIFTQKIENLQDFRQSLNQISMETNTEGAIWAQIQEEIETIDKKLEATQQKRQQVYNEFALARLREGFTLAEEALGWTYNSKSGIADAMVDYLAEIDERFLTREVNRCYSEIFNHLYDKLKGAKSNEDFEEEGRKLNVLKRMHETDSISIEEF